MTQSAGEFFRLLPAILGPSFRMEGEACIGVEPGWTGRIRVTPLTPLALGAIRLERIQVDLDCPGGPQADLDALLERFRIATQRGGG